MPNDEMLKVIYPPFSRPVAPGSRTQRFEIGAQRMQGGGLRPTSGKFARIPAAALRTFKNGSQAVDISKSQLRKVGGATIHGSTAGFAYVSDTSSITWYWDGTNGSRVPVITRADSSRFTVPTSGSGLTISGLAAATTYYFLPFWNISNLCNIGWVPGTTGSPQIAFVVGDTNDPVNNPIYLMQQTLQGNEPLSSGYMTAATTAGGAGGGGAGGGGGSGRGCVMAGTDIETLGDIEYTIEVLSETDWVHLRVEDTRELFCSYDHPLFHAVTGKTPASELAPGDLIITDVGEQKLVTAEFRQRVCSKHKVHMKKGHLYWANGFLSHNFKSL